MQASLSSRRRARRAFTTRLQQAARCGAALGAALGSSVAVAQAPATPEVTITDTRLPGPPVEQTTAGPVQGYRAITATSATRTPTPLEQIPQSIQVITRPLINDQNNQTVTEALRNVSG
nr:hypothetical protein [Burkholderiaceae bacterium]